MQSKSASEQSQPMNVVALASAIRLVGLVVLLGGVFVAYQVVETAWELFDDQKRVVVLSEKIEEATQINKTFSEEIDITRLMRMVGAQTRQEKAQEQGATEAAAIASRESGPEAKPLNLTYFAAWIIVFILLGMIARIGYWFMSAGGKIALYGTDQGSQLTTALRQVLIENRR